METLKLTIKENIAEIIFNRPDANNAINDVLISEFIQVLDKVELDNLVRVVCIKGAGKNFCAGADLNWMAQAVNYSREENIQDAKQFGILLEKIYSFSKPTIAIVQGAAYAGALGIISACDIAVARPEATFCFSEVKLGLIPAMISPYVISAIGKRQAKRYFLTGEVFNIHKAKEIGLIHEIGDEKILIKALLDNSPQAMSQCKKLFTGNENLPELLADIRASSDAQTRIKLFLEKKGRKK